MLKRIKFIIITTWILFSRSYDVYCTYQLTPDLNKESNPLTSIFGMTWTPLLITLSLLIIYLIYAYYLSVFKSKNLLPAEKGYTFNEFITYTYLGYKADLIALLYKFPKDINRFHQWTGENLTACISFAGFVSTIMWLLINHSTYYKTVHSSYAVYSILILGCLCIIYFKNKKMYQKYFNGIDN